MKSQKPLHKSLPGAVVAQYRNVGGKTYGPYWVRVWREGGKVRKSYVRPHDVTRVRAACDEGRLDRKRLARSRKELRSSLSEFAFVCRMLVRWSKRGDNSLVSDAEIARLENYVEGRCAS